jgi:FkbM family methyltransferase
LAPLVKLALHGRSDVEIESHALLRRLVRFPIRDKVADVTVPVGGRVTFPTDAAPHLYWGGSSAFEPEVVPAFVELCRDARWIVDVGANFGFYAVLAHLVAPAARVDAVEPNPLTFSALRETVELNGAGVRIHRLALSDTSGRVSLSLAGGLSSIVEDRARGQDTTVVECVQFDALFEGADLVKIDVEGAELHVLRGMRRTLSRHRPFVLAEIASVNLEPVASFLSSFGYEIVSLPLTPGRSTPGDNFLLRPSRCELLIGDPEDGESCPKVDSS